MKNVIKYYYGLDVEKIVEKNGNYHLLIDSNNYLLCKCNKEELMNVINYINNYNFHTIIKTLDGNIIIVLNNNEYTLLKINTVYKKISLEDINNFNYPVYVRNDSINRWISLWSNHIDYIEYQMDELSNKYPLLSRYVYYYIGLTETAIELLKTYENSNTCEYIMHKRINADMTLVDLYNPVYLVLDSRVRDMAEYYKCLFFQSEVDINNYMESIYSTIKNYSEIEIKLFFVRMLYPTYFFDLYDKIIGYDFDEQIIYSVINKSNDYEKVLVNLYKGIKKATQIENIEWLTQLH